MSDIEHKNGQLTATFLKLISQFYHARRLGAYNHADDIEKEIFNVMNSMDDKLFDECNIVFGKMRNKLTHEVTEEYLSIINSLLDETELLKELEVTTRNRRKALALTDLKDNTQTALKIFAKMKGNIESLLDSKDEELFDKTAAIVTLLSELNVLINNKRDFVQYIPPPREARTKSF